MIIISAMLAAEVTAQSLPDVKVATEFGVDTNLHSLLEERSILVMGFYHCKHMCNYIVKDLSRNLAKFAEYPKVIYFGIDENEGPRDALHLKKRILGPQKNRWSFVVADKTSITTMARTLNFDMRRDPITEVITHEMGIYSLDGKRVIKKLDALDLKESDLKSPSTLETIKKFCTQYDPRLSKNGPMVMRMLSVSSILFLLALGLGFMKLRRRT